MKLHRTNLAVSPAVVSYVADKVERRAAEGICHERMDTLDQFDDYVTRLRDANSRKHSFTARLKTACQPR